MRIADYALALAAALLVPLGCATSSTAADVLVAMQTVQYTEESFDKSNFGQLTVTAARRRCEDLLNVRLDLISETTDLDDSQLQQLALAGRLDIHRFFFDYKVSKQGIKFGTISRNQWQEQFAAAQKKILPLKTQYSEGLHGNSSLFFKSMTTILDDDQLQRVQAALRERAMAEYKRYIEAALAIIDRKVPLSVSQRTTITELLLTSTPPPEAYGTADSPVFAVLGRMSEIQNDLRPLFSDEEMNVIGQLIDVGRMMADRPEFLR